ncbi:MAG: aminotransferase class IV [Bdellovibrionia bacterium]
MQNAIINVNGTILGPEGAKVSVFDRGYLYGDSIYEVVRSYRGRFIYLDEHLKRLAKSAGLCRLTLNQSLEHYHQEIQRTFKAFRSRPGNRNIEVYARLIVTRGIGKIGFGLSCLLSPSQYTIIIQPVEALGRAQFEKGMKIQISKRLRNDPRALDPAMKSGNYLNSLLAYLEANEMKYPDAILCNAEGYVTEGTTFNVFYVRRGITATPPLDVGILDGITRNKVIQIANTLELPVREIRFSKERLYAADEVFLTSSIKEVFPITQIDDKKIGDGRPGPFTRKFHDHYRRSL